MKFEKFLATHAIPEWRSAYLNFHDLKRKVEEITVKYPEEEYDSEQVDYFDKFLQQNLLRKAREHTSKIQESVEEAVFLHLLENEIKRVYTFFSGQFTIAASRFDRLKKNIHELHVLRRHLDPSNAPQDTLSISSGSLPDSQGSQLRPASRWQCVVAMLSNLLHTRDSMREKEHGIKAAFLEHYRSLDLLKAYLQLNFTGFRKIVKKHKKMTGIGLDNTFEGVVADSKQCESRLAGMVGVVEQVYTYELCKGDRRAAMQALRVPELQFVSMDWSILFMGISLGILLLSAFIIVTATFRFSFQDFPDLFPATSRIAMPS